MSSIAIVACGSDQTPSVGDEVDTDTDTDSATESEPERDTDVAHHDVPPEPEPEPASDDSSSEDGGCIGECCDGECERECLTHYDCDLGSVCIADAYSSACLEIPSIAGCDEHIVAIGERDAGQITSLGFVDADGDGRDELAVGHPSGVHLLDLADGSTLTLLAATDGPVLDVTAGEFTGDGVGDLLVADTTALTVLAGDGAGSYAAARVLASPFAPLRVEALRWDGLATDEVVVLGNHGRAELVLGETLGDIRLGLDAAEVRHIATADFDGDGLDDVAVGGGPNRTRVFAGNPDSDVAADGEIGSEDFPANGIAAGHFTAVVPNVVVRHHDVFGEWTLLEGGNVGFRSEPQALFATGLASEAGDVNGDGFDDLVLVDTWEVTVAYGGASSAGMFSCATSHGLVTPGSIVAVGDHDGDGDAAIAVSHGAAITLLAKP